MTFHSVGKDGRTSLADFSGFAPNDSQEEADIDTNADIEFLSDTLDMIGVVENEVDNQIDGIEEVASVFELMGIPQRDDESQW